MMTATLTHREAETVVRALKHWRSHHDQSEPPKGERALTREEFDVLLAKLGICPLSTLRAAEIMADLLVKNP